MEFGAEGLGRVGRILRHDATLVGMAVASIVAAVAALTAATGAPRSGDVAAAPPSFHAEAELEAAALEEAPVPGREHEVAEGEIGRGETLAVSLGRLGVEGEVVHAIADGLSGHFDFRRAQPGQRYRLVRDPDGQLVSFRYFVNGLESYEMTREEEGFRVEHLRAELRPRVARIAGTVTSSLHEAVVMLGESGQLAGRFADIFAWDVDFSRSVHPGDEFRILYERLYAAGDDGSEHYVRPGRILAARWEGAAGDYTALYFEPEQGRGGYYRPDGSSVEGQFLRAPLRYSRISSRFTSARRHPILKITRPHHGIDYAAPRGTPIWAVGDGRVIYRGWGGGFGNLVKIRHAKGYVSYYAHLSRFAKGLRVGQSVEQKQVVGYVGSTGLATGPHVCFRISKDGRYVDPIRLRTPAGPPVSPEARPFFLATRDLLLAELEAGPIVAAEEAL